MKYGIRWRGTENNCYMQTVEYYNYEQWKELIVNCSDDILNYWTEDFYI